MISQNMTQAVSSEESLQNQIKKRKTECGCSNTDDHISYTKRVVPFVPDLPITDFGPWGRFATQCSQYSDQSDSSSSSSFYYSSESEDFVVPLLDNALESVSSKEVKRKDVPHQGLDSSNPIDLLETSDHEAKEVSRKILGSGFMPKGYKRHNRVLAIRDYPIPPAERFQTPFSQDSEFKDLMVSFPKNGLELIKSSVEERTLKASDDIKQTDLDETSKYEAKELSKEAKLVLSNSRCGMYNISLNSFVLSEEEGIDMPKVIDSMGLNGKSETSEPKATDLTEETAPNFMPPILTPKKIDSTTFNFPEVFRRRSPQIREEDILEATTFDTKGLNHNLSDAEDPLLEVQSESEESCSEDSCTRNLKESEKASSTGEKQVPKGQCSNQFLEKGPTTGENQVVKGPIQIVIALAAPNCPWMQKKTESRLNTTRNTNKRKRKR